MSGRDSKVLFAKYNTARCPDFRITTEICEDNNGLFVRKRPGDALAGAQLERIYEYTSSLQDYFRDIRVISAELGDGELRFPYIQGRTLAELIDTEHFDKERFIAQVNQKLETVLAIQASYTTEFETSDGFEALFGKLDVAKGIPAVNPANLDLLLTNFIKNDEAIYCIDCEWVFRFPVPIDFIKYRILLYLYVNKGYTLLNGITLEEMLGWFGFTKSDCNLYWQMEDAFQQYVHGEGRKYNYTEHYIRNRLYIDGINQEMQLLRLDCLVKSGTIHDKEIQIDNLVHLNEDIQKQLLDKESRIQSQEAQLADKDVQIQNLSLQFQTISNSFFWRVTKPARALLDGIKQIIKKNERIYAAFRAAKKALRHGP